MVELETPPIDPRLPHMMAAVIEQRDASLLAPDVSRRACLDWLTSNGFLLHGSKRTDLSRFDPRAPVDRSPDEFSKRTAVFASSDGVWAMMYALVDRDRVRGMLNSAIQVWVGGGWSTHRYYLSLAPDEPVVEGTFGGRQLLSPGSVYVLPSAGFERMPPYEWPDVGRVLEPHWASSDPVDAVLRIDVVPTDLPIDVRIHDADLVDARATDDPWGFPWLDDGQRQAGHRTHIAHRPNP